MELEKICRGCTFLRCLFESMGKDKRHLKGYTFEKDKQIGMRVGIFFIKQLFCEKKLKDSFDSFGQSHFYFLQSHILVEQLKEKTAFTKADLEYLQVLTSS